MQWKCKMIAKIVIVYFLILTEDQQFNASKRIQKIWLKLYKFDKKNIK